jgi:hypothetical protein
MSAHFLPGNLKKRSHKNSIIKKAIREGVKVLPEVLFTGMTETEAHAKEVELIAIYGRIDIGTGILANHTDGGEGVSGYIQKPESVAKMRKSKIGKPLTEDHKKKISASMMGMKRDDEMKAKVSKARKGSKHTAASKSKMSKSQTGKTHDPMTIEKMQFTRWDKNPNWAKADEIYEQWLDAGKPGREKFQVIIPGTRELSRKFAKGWNPVSDPTWTKYKEST